jgi:hypothetical protein
MVIRIAGVACCALVLAGCAGSAAPTGSAPASGVALTAAAQPPPPLPIAARTRIAGGSAAQRLLLRSVLRTFGPSEITRIAIRPAPRIRNAPPGSALIALHTLYGVDTKQLDLLGEWEGWVVGAAFRDKSERAGLPRVFLEQTPEGLHQIGDRASAKPYVGPSAARVKGELRRAVGRSGAHMVTLQVGQPFGAAALMRIQTTRPAAWFLARRLGAIITAATDRFSYDGLYLTVYDRSGRLIFTMANGTRMAIGADGVAVRRLEGCNPIANIGAIGGTQPSCPVKPVAMTK